MLARLHHRRQAVKLGHTFAKFSAMSGFKGRRFPTGII